jgi:glutaminyl-peptide cyclotransferase
MRYHQTHRFMKHTFIPLLALSLFTTSCKDKTQDTTDAPVTESEAPLTPQIDFVFVHEYPHDTTSFTEGFLVHDGKLFESTGATTDLPQTRSLFGIVDLATGKIDVKAEIDKEKYFGEGITFLNGKVFQLTYTTKIGFIYDAKTFKKLGDFTYPSKEGWGMTTDGTNLIMSDGTSTLTYLNPADLKVIKTISVKQDGFERPYLNELEYIKGYIYANIWTTNKIVKINPADGKVVGELDLTSLANEARNISRGSQEMNGIAYDSANDKVYVTGKMWPKIYEIKFDK